jgi:hypothetical protein
MTEEEIEDAAWKSLRFGEGDHIRDMRRMLSFVDGFIAGDSHGYQRARVEWLECLAESRQGYEQRIAELETLVGMVLAHDESQQWLEDAQKLARELK